MRRGIPASRTMRAVENELVSSRHAS
jgi:hypothetical protein